MIDLILWAANKADLATFARNRGLQVQVDGQWQNRPGFEYTWWAGSGQMKTKLAALQASAPVAIVQAGEFGFAVKPAWMAAGVYATRGGEVVGTFDRFQGIYSVFTETPGANVQVGETLDGWTPDEFLSGVVAICRFSAAVEAENSITPDPQDPEKDQPYKRNQIAKAIKDNGTPISVAGGDINGWEWDGVRIFLAADVEAWRAANGLPGHEWLGGNTY